MAQVKLGLGEIVIIVARIIRGSLCALCVDPDGQSKIYDTVAKKYILNDADVKQQVEKIAALLEKISTNGGDCVKLLEFSYDKLKELGECPAAETIFTAAKAEQKICTGEECKKLAEGCIGVSADCINVATGDAPAAAKLRRGLAASHVTSTDGGITAVASNDESQL